MNAPQFTSWFFRNFFRLLILFVAIAECAVAWWICAAIGIHIPLSLAMLGPVFVYGMNLLIRELGQRRLRAGHSPGVVPRIYYAAAFTSLFCFAFLLLSGVIWAAATVFMGALAVQALPILSHAPIVSTLDTAFRWVTNTGLVVISIAFAYGYTVGRSRLKVTRLAIPIRHATGPACVRIAHISDIHIGQNLEPGQLAHFVARVNALQPDLICITGDILDGPTAPLERMLPVLGRLPRHTGCRHPGES